MGETILPLEGLSKLLFNFAKEDIVCWEFVKEKGDVIVKEFAKGFIFII